MPLEFLARIADAHLPVVVARPSDMAALHKCVAAGYLEIAPLAVKNGPSSTILAARVTAVLPEGTEALRCLRENFTRSSFQPLA